LFLFACCPIRDGCLDCASMFSPIRAFHQRKQAGTSFLFISFSFSFQPAEPSLHTSPPPVGGPPSSLQQQNAQALVRPVRTRIMILFSYSLETLPPPSSVSISGTLRSVFSPPFSSLFFLLSYSRIAMLLPTITVLRGCLFFDSDSDNVGSLPPVPIFFVFAGAIPTPGVRFSFSRAG